MAWRCGLLGLILFAFNSQAEIRFEKSQIKVGDTFLNVELAQTPEQQARGLMYRRELVDSGMLFVFDQERIQRFWTKNTFVALDIGFFDRERRLIQVLPMEPVKSVVENPRTYESKGPAQYVLEVPQGWFKKNSISVGARLELTSKPGPSSRKK